jgi:large subunit ribosomal protein L6
MSRLAKKPIVIPNGVSITIVDVKNEKTALMNKQIQAKGKKGNLSFNLDDKAVLVEIKDSEINVKPAQNQTLVSPLVGTTFRSIQNLIKGVSEGFESKLELVGVGYRAKMQGDVLELSLGKSHPIFYEAPEGITIEVPSATSIVVKGAEKDKVGQVAAEIRKERPPEVYKGKGVRYEGEKVNLKEVKKK